MDSTNLVKMIPYIILISSIFLVVDSSIIGKVSHDAGKYKGLCECGAFPSREVKEGEEPIIKNNVTVEFVCPPDDTCKNLCKALAQAAKASGAMKICSESNQEKIDNLYVSVFARACGNEKWEYTDLSATDPICCNNKLPIPCKDTELESEANKDKPVAAESSKDLVAVPEEKKEEAAPETVKIIGPAPAKK